MKHCLDSIIQMCILYAIVVIIVVANIHHVVIVYIKFGHDNSLNSVVYEIINSDIITQS